MCQKKVFIFNQNFRNERGLEFLVRVWLIVLKKHDSLEDEELFISITHLSLPYPIISICLISVKLDKFFVSSFFSAAVLTESTDFAFVLIIKRALLSSQR
jgi:hypothetical protein